MVKRPRVGKKIGKKVRGALNDIKDDIESIKVPKSKAASTPEAIDEAIHDDIQNGKIEAAMASITTGLEEAIEAAPAPEPAPAPKPKATPAPKATTSRVLRRGSTGPDVAAIQMALGVVEDGFSFGTQVAVQNFQRRVGLPVTGIVDAETQAKILG